MEGLCVDILTSSYVADTYKVMEEKCILFVYQCIVLEHNQRGFVLLYFALGVFYFCLYFYLDKSYFKLD